MNRIIGNFTTSLECPNIFIRFLAKTDFEGITFSRVFHILNSFPVLIYHIQAEMNTGVFNVKLYKDFECMEPVRMVSVENK